MEDFIIAAIVTLAMQTFGLDQMKTVDWVSEMTGYISNRMHMGTTTSTALATFLLWKKRHLSSVQVI